MTLMHLSLGRGGPNIGTLDCPPEPPPIGTCEVCKDEINDAEAWRIDYGEGFSRGYPSQTGHMECVRDLWLRDTHCQIEAQGLSAIADGQLAEIIKVKPCSDCGLVLCGCPS